MDKGFENMALGLVRKGAVLVGDDKRRRFAEGRDYWWQYQRLNGYAFRPSEEGLRKLSRNLDLNITHLRKCINIFLNS